MEEQLHRPKLRREEQSTMSKKIKRAENTRPDLEELIPKVWPCIFPSEWFGIQKISSWEEIDVHYLYAWYAV